MIDRSNYELWFTDWADNRLNAEEIGELAGFLRANPDLDEEFRNLNSSLSLQPPDESFPFRKELHKKPEDLSLEQFDILCAAYYENDLSPSQSKELEEMLRLDASKQRSFELMGKMHLVPPAAGYRNKGKLLKHSPVYRSIWLPAAGLSAAAVLLALLVFTFFRPSGTDPASAGLTDPGLAQNIIELNAEEPIRKAVQPSVQNNLPVNVNSRAMYSNNQPVIAGNITPVITREEPVKKLDVNNGILISGFVPSGDLVAVNYLTVKPETDDDRSRVGKFLARTFREKILNDRNAADTPVKGYELAEAGVTGINKLLGWDMQFITNNNAEGQPVSVRFNSRLLKFSAPVKKNESAE